MVFFVIYESQLNIFGSGLLAGQNLTFEDILLGFFLIEKK